MKNRAITKRSFAGLFVIRPALATVKANCIGQNNPTDEAIAQKFYAKNRTFARAEGRLRRNARCRQISYKEINRRFSPIIADKDSDISPQT